jgi:hypothetical protein
MPNTNLHFICLHYTAITKAKGTYKGINNTTESSEKFLTKYPGVINYLNKKSPPTLVEIAKLTDCSKNTVQKVKRILYLKIKSNTI